MKKAGQMQGAARPLQAMQGNGRGAARASAGRLASVSVLACVVWLAPVWAQGPCTAGIETVAGYVPLGDGGPATAAALMGPSTTGS